jgi:hypothetical protein
MKFVEYDGKPTWSDWSLIKVARDGIKCEDINNITFSQRSFSSHVPSQVQNKSLITGTTTESLGELVMKRGRTTDGTVNST